MADPERMKAPAVPASGEEGKRYSVSDPASSAQMLLALLSDLDRVGFHFDEDMVQRFLASLLTKRFLILTGMTGSGKTKLGQAIASWLSERNQAPTQVGASSSDGSVQKSPTDDWEWLPVGAEIPSDRVKYHVDAIDSLSVQFSNERDGNQRVKVTLPKGLIEEWVAAIRQGGHTRSTAARTIREQVARTTAYSTQLNSFETHLKAAAFAMIEQQGRYEVMDDVESPYRESDLPHPNDLPSRSGNFAESSTYRVVAVGADWTSGESILGYPDALQPTKYIRTPALELILRANANPGVPHFLILDEMNLSHVERYFSDILSSMESGEPIHLYSLSGTEVEFRDSVPPSILLPDNLFIIGTVNVDETTYMFSPKVLDRANTIEFRVSADALDAFLEDPTALDLERLYGGGSRFAQSFMRAARNPRSRSSGATRSRVNAEIGLFFAAMAGHGNEFGFRTALEMSRFVDCFQALSSSDGDVARAIDAQVYQKILPRLSGSRARLEPVLRSLLVLCRYERQWDMGPNGKQVLVNRNAILEAAAKAGASPQLVAAEPSELSGTTPAKSALYPLSESKLLRMFRLLSQNGFTSFAEA